MGRRLNILIRTDKFSCFQLDQSIFDFLMCNGLVFFIPFKENIVTFSHSQVVSHWRNIHGTTWLLIFIPVKPFCLLINESPAKLCLWQGKLPGYTPLVKTMERTRICGSFIMTFRWFFYCCRCQIHEDTWGLEAWQKQSCQCCLKTF